MREWRVTFFFFLSNWDGAPMGVGALRKLRTLRIGSGGTGRSALLISTLHLERIECDISGNLAKFDKVWKKLQCL